MPLANFFHHSLKGIPSGVDVANSLISSWFHSDKCFDHNVNEYEWWNLDVCFTIDATNPVSSSGVYKSGSYTRSNSESMILLK